MEFSIVRFSLSKKRLGLFNTLLSGFLDRLKDSIRIVITHEDCDIFSKTIAIQKVLCYNMIISLMFAMLFALTACGKEKSCEHHYESETIKQASYYSDGELKKICIFCNDKTSEIIPKLEMPIEVSVTAIETFEQERAPLVMPGWYGNLSTVNLLDTL